MIDFNNNDSGISGENLKKIFIMLLVTTSLVLFGATGYHLIEGWPFFDALYMTVITVTTVGFGEVHPLSTEGRILTSLLIFLGFGLFAFSCTQLAKMIVEGEVAKFFGSRKMKKKIDLLKKHFIICGYGRVGSTVCHELKKKKIDFVVIDPDENFAKQAKEDGYHAICGNSANDNVLFEAGIQRASGLISLTGDDSINLFITLSARELNHSLYIVSRGEDKSVEQKLLRAGADVVVVPSMIGGLQIAHFILLTKKKDIENELDSSGTYMEGFQLKTYFHSGGHIVPVEEIVKQTHALLPVCLIRSNNEKISLPSSASLVHPSESLILLVQDTDIAPHEENEIEDKEESKRILLVDDHHSLLSLFQKKFSSAGFNVTIAKTGKDALHLIQEFSPDIVILDACLPVISGYEVCQHVKKDDSLKHIPIILFSGENIKELRKKGAEVGADVCISKTIRSNELLQVVNDLLEKK